jgi:hypothetical protein
LVTSAGGAVTVSVPATTVAVTDWLLVPDVDAEARPGRATASAAALIPATTNTRRVLLPGNSPPAV